MRLPTPLLKGAVMNSRKLSAFLITAFLLVYAVAPLSYAVPHLKAAARDEPVLQGVNDPSAEPVFVSSAQRRAVPGKEDACTVLMKKKRALPEDEASRLVPNTSAVPAFGLPRSEAVASLFIDTYPLQNTHAGFNPLHAGHAPPLM